MTDARANLRTATAHAAEVSVYVTDMLATTAGAVAIFETCPLERAVRDVHAAVKHIAMSPKLRRCRPIGAWARSRHGEILDPRSWRGANRMEQRQPYDDLMGKSHSEPRPIPQLRLRGNVVLEGNAGYDEARRVWNGAIDRRPAMIAYCADTQDVVEAVTFARSRTFPVAVRSGGHNVAGPPL